jgi:hypothetical protein
MLAKLCKREELSVQRIGEFEEVPRTTSGDAIKPLPSVLSLDSWT